MIDMKHLDNFYSSQIRETCMSGDEEGDHSRADDLLIELLTLLDLTKTVDAWKEVGKWYA